MLPTYTGSAYYDSENKLSKISFDDMLENDQAIKVRDSLISMIEHYFFTAWLPTGSQIKTVYTNHENGVFTIGSTSQYDIIQPGQNYKTQSVMFVGPKLQSEISGLADGLDLTVDYGVLTFLSAPLFWILEIIYAVFDNWGMANFNGCFNVYSTTHDVWARATAATKNNAIFYDRLFLFNV